MELVLTYRNGNYCLYDKNARSKGSIRRVNGIIRVINKIGKPKKALIMPQDLKIFFGDNSILLKDFCEVIRLEKNEQIPLYSIIDEEIIRKISKKQKVNFINKRRLIAFTLALSTLVSAKFISKNQASTINFSQQTEQLSNNAIDKQNELEKPERFKDHLLTLTDNRNYEINKTKSLEKRLDLNTRLQESQNILNSVIINNELFPLATRLTPYALSKITKFLNSSDGLYVFKYSDDFGIDPYLLCSMMMLESSLDHNSTIPGGKNYNGFAVGYSQLENPNGKLSVTAFNYTTGENETVLVTMDNAKNPKTNIKIGAMLMQNSMHKYKNNLYLVLQAHNYGLVLDKLINLYAKETNRTFNEVCEDYNDTGWMKYVIDMNRNPSKYIGDSWRGKYGNADYINNVLSYYVGTVSKNVIEDGTVCYYDLRNNAITYENIKSR